MPSVAENEAHIVSQTVPQRQYLWTVSDSNDLLQYPNHTRVTHRKWIALFCAAWCPKQTENHPYTNEVPDVQDGICSLGYAITQKAARKLLYEVGLKDVNAAFDIMLRWFCEGTGNPNRGYHNCLTVQPSIFQIHLPGGPKKYSSDISDHGEGDEEKKTEILRLSVKMNAEALLDGRTDLVDQYPDVG